MISYVAPQTPDSLRAHSYQPRGAFGRDAFGQVLGYRDGLLFGDLGPEQGSVLALGELAGAGPTAQVADTSLP